ncbi:hypothetical protein M8998_07525 [Sphingobacterium sp. lm-10]|uniref:hypothetical protein n=1 Tax=Sphingobacterium sp. lm-10 TaxID=2944904 RepID=UPI00202243D0|nr:hypothetical protein [Sphingobacterium sp. lm-10]MCL7987785.1 hypothetical protein [Sphingobacterium sp. lm-10]
MSMLISGLNSYLGRRAASNLASDDCQVYGLIRDAKLFEATGFEPVTAKLLPVDLLRKEHAYTDCALENLEVGICFAPSTNLDDHVSLQVELTRLKNFITLLQTNQCNRVVYFARLVDRDYITYIQQLFVEYQIDYTLVLANIALGKHSLADRYFRQLMMEKYVWYDEALANVEFRPIAALDVLRWIRTINWQTDFINQVLELGGVQQMSVRELFRMYKNLNDVSSVGVAVPHFIYSLFFQRKRKLQKEDHLEIKRMFRYEYPLDNTTWAKRVSFSFTPIEEVILQDQ